MFDATILSSGKPSGIYITRTGFFAYTAGRKPMEGRTVRICSTFYAFAIISIDRVTARAMVWMITDMHAMTCFTAVTTGLKLFTTIHAGHRIL